jgi:hypothetical protein
MGPGSIDITVDRYGHLLEHSNPEEAARLSGFVFNAKSADDLRTEPGKDTAENGKTVDNSAHEESVVTACHGSNKMMASPPQQGG